MSIAGGDWFLRKTQIRAKGRSSLVGSRFHGRVLGLFGINVLLLALEAISTENGYVTL